MTKAEFDYMGSVKALGCLVCGSPAEFHHVRRYGEKRNHFKGAPLCPFHHRGPEGIHEIGKKRWERRYMTQDAMLTLVNKKLRGNNDYRN